ncbi:MAG: nucleotidyltransferase domain-containing protein [Microscillaceae bacterium]|jgi:hypothetical protein|nr:nucleotidyltransferase domain-containing protein [Microscillaceae bacterium]
MTIEDLKQQQLLIFECISGSKAYGLATPQSDTDIRGVFILPKAEFYGLNYVEQVNNASNDVVYYELKKFLDLLAKNNPNILEMLNMPADCILYENPLFAKIKQFNFLSKLCQKTFAGYAMSQVKKARGLNKKILNPMEKKRKSILDFCYVTHQQGSMALATWLAKHHLQQENCGLVKITNMCEVYALFYDASGGRGYRGIAHKDTSNEVALSSIPAGESPLTYLSFNKDGYSSYCKDYLEYWDWVEKRNDARYQNTLDHGKNYDSKNMMHTFRLLDMAEEIAQTQQVVVRRSNRDFLFKIRRGEFEYEQLLQMAEAKIQNIENLYLHSNLPEEPNILKINELLIETRESFYANE